MSEGREGGRGGERKRDRKREGKWERGKKRQWERYIVKGRREEGRGKGVKKGDARK